MCLKFNIDTEDKFRFYCIQQKTYIMYSFINMCLQHVFFLGNLLLKCVLIDILFLIMIQFKYNIAIQYLANLGLPRR